MPHTSIEVQLETYNIEIALGYLQSNTDNATNLTYTASPTNGIVVSDTGTDATLTLVDGTNAGLMTPANFTKLAGIASGATANSSDATLLARANHTGTQAISTVAGLQTALDSKQNTITNSDSITQGTTNLFLTTAERTKLSNTSGTNTGDNAVNTLYSGLVSNATHTGDVTGSTALTIANGAVTLAKMANMATSSLIYRKTAGAGVPEVNTLATLKTDLALTKSDVGLSNVDNTSDATKNSATVTLTNKTVNLASNTLTGTTAQFNTALSDGDFATLANTVSLTNKTLSTGTIIENATGTTNAQTGTTYTLLSSDNGKIITISNASPIVLTVPSGLGAGFNCTVIQKGVGVITFTASSTTIVNRQNHTKTAGQHAVCGIYADVANNFYLTGDTAT